MYGISSFHYLSVYMLGNEIDFLRFQAVKYYTRPVQKSTVFYLPRINS